MFSAEEEYALDAMCGGGAMDCMEASSVFEAMVAAAEQPVCKISMIEVAKHCTAKDCWVVLHGKVYDLTKFAPQHVGGMKAITNLAGKDGTAPFAAAHGENVLKGLSSDCCLGDVDFTTVADLHKVLAPGQSQNVTAKTVNEDQHPAYQPSVVAGNVADRHRQKRLVNDHANMEQSSMAKRCKEEPAVASTTAVVIGGGLAGLSAANTVLEWGGNVVLLEKTAFCGGNSTRATSGISAAGTTAQTSLGVSDSAEGFADDTLKGGARNEQLVKLLCHNSASDVEWLMKTFGLDLSLVGQLGGHSKPRTHRGKTRFPGMTITYALLQKLEAVAENNDAARIINRANVTRLLTDASGACIGCAYEKAGVEYVEYGPVIVATGGFAADFSADSLLTRHRPDLVELATTNAEHCTGDGIKLSEAIGARTLDLDWVQVHPTGLVDPTDPACKVKLLAAEALRGAGGLLIDADGHRFVDELGRRDIVTAAMKKKRSPFRLILNRDASEEIRWHCEHYANRGVMTFYQSGRQLAEAMGVALSTLEDMHEEHYQAAKSTEEDPNGGPWPAAPPGRSWDRPSGIDGNGKTFFRNVIRGGQVSSEPFYVAVVEPVLHYCMGGVEITDGSCVVGSSGAAIPGLFAAGEVTGGIHGNNRLGGNSLLDCVVFGRVAGKAAVQRMLGKDATFAPVSDPVGRVSENADSVVCATVTSAKRLSPAEVAKHAVKDDCWVSIHGRVYDVTHFLKDHPGGALSILAYAGKDATKAFDMVHPANILDKYADSLAVGTLATDSPAVAAASSGRNLPSLQCCPCCCGSITISDQSTGRPETAKVATCTSCGIDISITLHSR